MAGSAEVEHEAAPGPYFLGVYLLRAVEVEFFDLLLSPQAFCRIASSLLLLRLRPSDAEVRSVLRRFEDEGADWPSMVTMLNELMALSLMLTWRIAPSILVTVF